MHTKHLLAGVSFFCVTAGGIVLGQTQSHSSRHKPLPHQKQSIHDAVKSGSLPAVETLIRNGWKINRHDKAGNTLLIYSAKFNQLGITRYLLNHGAVYNELDNEGKDALSYAQKFSAVKSFLLDAYEKTESRPGGSLHSVVYKVTGAADYAVVTYEEYDGAIEQECPVSLPWHTTFNGSAGDFLSISAQNSTDSGDVDVEIDVDGKTRKFATAEGAYAVVSTQDTL